jgi:Flp pilus assembly protein TadD
MLKLMVPVLLLASGSAMAAERTGYTAIAAGALDKAQTLLEAEQRANPGRPEVMLNLAAVYQRSGRPEAARSLYAGVLAEKSVAMDMPSGAVVSSHVVAERGLAKLGPAQIATR